MYYEFYIDQFFLEHLLTGYLLLSASASIRRLAVSRKRIVLGSLANAAVMTAAVCLGTPFGYPAGMISAGIVAFSGKNGGGTGKGLVSLAFLTVCFGGALEALYRLTGFPLVAAAAAAAVLVRGMAGRMEKRKKLDVQVRVKLWRGEQEAEFAGIIDTGNRLVEPLTGRPVSIIDEDGASALLEGGWETQKGFYLIPYHSIGRDKGWLQGVAMDRMVVEEAGKTTEIKNPVLAIYKGHVSGQGRYQVILHPLHGSPEG